MALRILKWLRDRCGWRTSQTVNA